MEFVVGASEPTMKSLLGKLGGLLAQEYSVIRGVRGDVQYINDELATMQAFLGDIGSAPDGNDRRLKDWMKQIRDMAYDMEDCIDDFAHRLPYDSLIYVKCSFIVTRIHELWTFWPRRKIASRICELKIRAQHIAERRSRYGVDNPKQIEGSTTDKSNIGSSGPCGIAEHLMPSRQLIHTEEPVGIDMQKLRDWLENHNDSEKHRSMLSIVGFGGVGKTTIASALYREFRNQFDYRASVTVSQNYDEDQVLRDIIGQIKPQDSKNDQQGSTTIDLDNRHLGPNIKNSVMQLSCHWSAVGCRKQQGNERGSGGTQTKIEAMIRDQLIKELQGHLKGKRYLLLIDDIWSAETWENIRNWLPHANIENSRVIVTTRFQAVGAACSERDGTDFLHAVNVLNDVNSKRLFVHSVSKTHSSKVSEPVGRTSQAPDPVCSNGSITDHEDTANVPESQSNKGSKKEEVHKEMWEYCGGLPLALVSMAGLVGCNPTKTNEHWSKVCKSLFPDLVAPLTFEEVTRILDYCYNDLPADLNTCGLYLSIFPKGLKISRKRLTWRWISECFVTEKQGLPAEEVAETDFNQLISRKIIRPVDHRSNGKIKSFKVHDMILEYMCPSQVKRTLLLLLVATG